MTPEFLAARRIVRRGQVLTALGLLAAAAVYVIAIYFTPVEVRQGPAQKIFYVHVPSAWSAFLAFGIVGVCSALFLWLHDRRLDLFLRLVGPAALAGVVAELVKLLVRRQRPGPVSWWARWR